MNEFLEQFLVECRELVQQATLDLLAVENNADDETSLDSAFRSFHTLKGGAGIIEFPEMVNGLHAAEGLLASARTGARAMDVADIGNCLWALDRVTAWLDEIEETGSVPSGAGPVAEEMVRRFQAQPGPTDGRQVPAPDWLDGLSRAHPDLAGQAVVALMFQPDAEVFFSGEDPLSLIAGLPGLLAMQVEEVNAWPPLAEIDPFECNLRFAALSSASKETVLRYIEAKSAGAAKQIEMYELSTHGSPKRTGLSPIARLILEAQRQLLLNDELAGMAGRVGAARRVVTNILRQQPDQLDAVSSYDRDASAGSGRDVRASLQKLIEQALDGNAREVQPAAQPASRAPASASSAATRSLRVSVERIDALVNLTGELSIAKNALSHAANLARAGTAPASLAVLLEEQQSRLERLVIELQRSVLSIRVLPMRQVFQRFQRLVRDLAAETGKTVTLVTSGDETEADKAVVEALGEPIMHVVRNAIDHGIETVEERQVAGKSAQATISMRAAKVGNTIVVEVEDDGRGVDFARVRQIAAEKGLIAGAGTISDDDTLELLFKPGFSTAATVNTTSGRGVGMDAVRSATEALGGSVVIDTEAGTGTIVTFTLPVSILMTALVTVEAAGQVFGIPLEKVVETRRVALGEVSTVGAARAFVHRGHAVPLVSLAATVGETAAPTIDVVQVVIVAIDNQLCGIEVDRLGEKVDILMRPAEGVLAGLEGIAGVAILGDGRVMLVLDLETMLQ